MGCDKKYRWQIRRDKKSRLYKSFRLDIFDWVMMILIFTIFFLSLRLFFIFQTVSAPCVELLITLGKSSTYPSIFELTYFISLLMGLFWLCVTLGRLFAKRDHRGLIAWHIILGISIVLLAFMNWNMTSLSYVAPPDGVMVVEDVTPINTKAGISWQTPDITQWAEYRDGQWYAVGAQACIWLDEGKVSYNDRFYLNKRTRTISTLFFSGRPAIDVLKDNQLYRPLKTHERENFIRMKNCQTDIMKYGQPRSACTSDYIYLVAPGLAPTADFLENWPRE